MMHGKCSAWVRICIVFLGLFFSLSLIYVAASTESTARTYAIVLSEGLTQKFRDVNNGDESTVTALSTFHQSGGTEHPSGYSEGPKVRLRKEISYGENKLILLSDQRERVGEKRYRVTGNVVISILDMVVTCNEAEYNEDTLRVSTLDETWFRQKGVSLTASSAVFDPGTQTVILHDASGYFYDTQGRSEREFFLTGGMVQHIKMERLQIHWSAAR